KPKGGVRPIAIGEVFYKLAALYAIKTAKPTIRETLGESQFALLPGGAEAAVHCLRTAMMEHPKWAIIGCDIKNAFNTRNRRDILCKLYKTEKLRSLWRITHWAYGAPTKLLITNDGTIVETIESSQGDALSALLFALSMTEIYQETAESSGCKMVAVQDDVYFMGTPHSAAKAWDSMRDLVAEDTGLELNKEKTNILIPDDSDAGLFTSRGLSPTTSFIPALGTILTKDGPLLS